MNDLSHLDESGAARMVDVGPKNATARRASASARVRVCPDVVDAIARQALEKGDVLAAARIAGIVAAKRTAELIPLCHPLRLDTVAVEFTFREGAIDVVATVAAHERTGVEMEALTAASVAALTIYDMCKSRDRGMTIERIRLESKEGGKSGPFQRKDRFEEP